MKYLIMLLIAFSLLGCECKLENEVEPKKQILKKPLSKLPSVVIPNGYHIKYITVNKEFEGDFGWTIITTGYILEKDEGVITPEEFNKQIDLMNCEIENRNEEK